MRCNINNYNYHPLPVSKLKEHIRKICEKNDSDESTKVILCNSIDYMIQTGFCGGCHVLSSALYVAFNEIGLSPKLYIGECQKFPQGPFDHSWITLNDKKIDLAIYMTFDEKINSVSGPIIFDIDAITMRESKTQYGINSGLPFSNETKIVLNTEFTDYMSGWQLMDGGIWELVKIICPSLEKTSTNNLIKKYKDTERILVR